MNPFRRNNRLTDRGVAAIEFAGYAAATAALLLTLTDLAAYLKVRLRLDQVSSSTASNATLYQTLYTDDVDTLAATAQQMAGNMKVTGADGATILTGISNINNNYKIVWQAKRTSSAFTSSLGAVGAAPSNMPDNLVLPNNTSVIVAEVMTNVTLNTTKIFTGAQVLRSLALFQPRAAVLPELVSGNRP